MLESEFEKVSISTAENDTVGQLGTYQIHPRHFTQPAVYIAMHIVDPFS